LFCAAIPSKDSQLINNKQTTNNQLLSSNLSNCISKMTKLYYTPTSCGAASFIAAFVAGVHIDTETVDLGTHKTHTGADYYAINPKGNVPGLVLDNGVVLNEGAAVLQYIGDQVCTPFRRLPIAPRSFLTCCHLPFFCVTTTSPVGSWHRHCGLGIH
jgi:hypothetical protein